MAAHSTGFWTTLTTLAVTVAVATAAAVAVVDPSTDDVVVYDQRQNGTENVRISLSDLKVVLAPADGLLQIMSMAGAQFLNSELSHSASEHRPTTGAECTGFKCNNRHRQAAKKNRFKLSSLIVPLLSQAEQKTVVETESNSNNDNSNAVH